MLHIILLDLVIISCCWGKTTALLFAILANVLAVVEWQVQKHLHTKELSNSIKEERLKTTARFRKGDRLL